MDLRDASLGFYRVWHVAVGHRAGLLDALPSDAATLARKLRLDRAAVARWLEGAHALGLVSESGGRYHIARGLAARLDPTHPETLVHQFAYLADKSLGFGALPALLEGKPPRSDLARVYATATTWDHLAFFERALPREPDVLHALREGARVLDLGAGLGGWARKAARRFPRADVRATDLAIAPLRRALRGSRVRVVAMPEPSSYDIVFLGEVLAATADPVSPLAVACRAVRPGGVVLAMEGLLPPEGRARGWGDRLIRAMALDFALDGSRFLTREEAARAFHEAGLVRRRSRALGGAMHLLRGQRPKRQAAAARA